MFALPQLHQLKDATERQNFSRQYAACSGLPIPDHYLLAADTRVFAFCLGGKMIGGFILGSGQHFRTIELFARPENQQDVYAHIGTDQPCTEICCLWMSHAYRKNTWINTLNWVAMATAVKKYASPNLLFGTCSLGLARLYATSNKAELIARDRINRRKTYIFQAKKKNSLIGFANIIKAKLLKRFALVGLYTFVSKKTAALPALVATGSWSEYPKQEAN